GKPYRILGPPWENQPASRLERLQPGKRRHRKAGIHVNDIRGRQIEGRRITMNDLHIGVGCEVARGAYGQFRLDLDGSYGAAGRHQQREDRAVVAAAGPHVADAFAWLKGDLGHPHRVKQRLAIIDPLVVIQRDKDIMVKMRRIITRRPEEVAYCDHPPWSWPDKIFAGHGGKRLFDAWVGDASLGGQHTGVETADFRDVCHATKDKSAFGICRG